MEVLLVRHAKSFYDWDKYPTDAERPLSKKGKEREEKVAKGMKRNKLSFDLVWVSPFRRARETLDIIQKYQKEIISPIIVPDLVPGGDEDKILALLKEQAIKTPNLRLLVVGHNPLLSLLLELIDSSSIDLDMRTSDVAHCLITEKSSELIKYYSRKDLMDK